MKTSKTARQWSVKQRIDHIIKKISLCEKERIRGILKSRFKKYEISAMFVNWKVFGGWWRGQKSAQRLKLGII